MAFTTATLLTFGLGVAGLGMQAMSAYQQAEGEKKRLAYDAQVQRNNQKIAQDNMDDVEVRGQRAIYDQRRRIARTLSSIRTSTAASGLVVDDEGSSSQQAFEDMADAGELDVMQIRNNIDREKRRALITVNDFQAKGDLADFEARSINPMKAALGTTIGGLGSVPLPAFRKAA